MTVPGPRPSYLSSASSLTRAARSAAVISGLVVSLAPTGPAAACRFGGGCGGLGGLFTAGGERDGGRGRMLRAQAFSCRISLGRGHSSRRGPDRQGEELGEDAEKDGETKRPVACATGPFKTE